MPNWVESFQNLSSEWHPSKNRSFSLADFSKGSSKKVWWVCAKSHEWEAVIGERTKGSGCPYCSNSKVFSGFNDLDTKNPELASQWNFHKNITLNPKNVLFGSHKKIWWVCDKGHEWEATIVSRNKNNRGCPYCSKKLFVEGTSDLATLKPHLTSQWHIAKNSITPNKVNAGSHQKAWWICDKGHEWEAIIANRARGINCPVCSNKKVLEGFNDFDTTNPKIALEWHPTKNDSLTPKMVSTYSSKQVWWVCDKGHEWKTRVADRCVGKGCPYCAGQLTSRGFNDLVFTFPLVAAEWHPIRNLNLSAYCFTAGSNKRVWWVCDKGHEWKSAIIDRTNGSNCPVCCGKKVLKGFNDLQTTHPVLASQWHLTKNELKLPVHFSLGSGAKVWWVCDKGHEWEAAIVDRKNGNGCRLCSASNSISNAEEEIYIFLKTLNIAVERSNRKVLKGKELDLFLPKNRIAIEYNGLYWHSEEQGKDKTYHYNKWFECREQGIQLIQIWEDEWKKNKQLVLETIKNKIYESTPQTNHSKAAKISFLTIEQAKIFLNKNHIGGFVYGKYYLGLIDTENVIQGAMVFDEENHDTLNIVRYFISNISTDGFAKLLSYAEEYYGQHKYVIYADHNTNNDLLYRKNGFIINEEIPPDYTYVIKGVRQPRSRKLLPEVFPRIWDAGKTCWMKNLNL